MDLFFTILWRIEFPLSIFLCFLAIYIPAKKAKYTIYILIGSFLLLGGFWYTLSFISDFVWVDILFYLIFYVGLFVVSFFCVEGSKTRALFNTIIVICLQHLAYRLSLSVILLIDPNLYSRWYFLFMFFMIALVDTLYYFVFFRRGKNLIMLTGNLTYYLVLIILIISSLFISYFIKDLLFETVKNDKLTATMINLSGIIVPVLCMIAIYQSAIATNMKEENLVLSLILQKDKERYRAAKVTIDEINIKYHDIKHMLQDDKISEERKASIRETVTDFKSIIHSGNRGIDVIVYEKQLICHEYDIELSALIDGASLSFIKNYHLYSIFGNLLDNAIDACKKLESNRRIDIRVKNIKQNALITISNPMKGELRLLDGLPITTKENILNHGYGLKSVRRTVEMYHGTFSVDTSNHVFTASILIPIPEVEKVA